MPIDPRLALVSISNTEGVAQRTADLARRVAKLEAVRTSIGDASIVGTQVQTGTLDASNLNVGSVTAAILTVGAINAGMIQANAIQTIHLDAQVVTAAKIAAGTITANEIAANTITAGQIAAGTITATQIHALTITSNELAANSVTATKISVANLAAINTDMGSISAGTITGGTIQSGTSGSRWVGDGTGIRGYALDGVTKTFEMNTGSGVMTVNGVVIAQAGSALPAAVITGNLGSGGNQVYNSGFEITVDGTVVTVGWDGWGVLGGGTGSIVTSASVGVDANRTVPGYGNKALKITTTANAQFGYLEATSSKRQAVVAGDTYAFSAYVGASTTGRSAYMSVNWYNSAGSIISTPTVAVPVAISSTGMTRIGGTGVAPGGALPIGDAGRAVVCTIRPVGVNNGLSGDAYYFDNLQMERSDVITSYAPKADEILANQISGPELAAGSVTTAKMTAGTINGNVISAGTITSTEINATSVRTAVLTAGSVTASTIGAGAIQAQHLSISTPQPSVIKNGTFTSGTVNAAYDNWSDEGPLGSGTWTTEADTAFGFVAKSVITTTTNTYRGQTVVLPKGRHVVRSWVRGTTVTGTVTRAGLYAALISGTATITLPSYAGATGTFDWQLQELTVDVPAAPATVRVYLNLAGSSVAGTLYWANIHTLSSVTTTEITPGAITTGTMTANAINGDRIAAGTLDALKIIAGSVSATQLAAGSITADKIGFRAGGTNLAKNSSFEQGVGNTTATNATPTTGAFPRTGALALVLTSAAAGAFTASNVAVTDLITPATGALVTMTAYVKAPSVARVASILPSFYTAANATVAGTVTGTAPTVISVTATTTTAYQRVQLTFPFIPGSNGVPATAAKLGWTVSVAGAAAAAEVVHIDDVQVEFSDIPTDWSQYIDPTVIDGSTITAPTIRTSATNPRVQLDGTNGLSVTDASGNIVSQMKASAGGMDLAVTNNTAPVDERKLRFTSSGVSYGDLLVGSGAWTGFDNTLRLTMSPPSSVFSGEAETLITTTHTGAGANDQAQVRLYHTGSGQNGVQATAGPLAAGGSTQATILRDDGGSSYVIADQGGYISGSLSAPAGGGFNNAASAFSYTLLRGSGFDATGAWTCARPGTYRITVHIDYQNSAANTTAAGDMLLNGVTALVTTRIHNGVAASRVNGCGFFERAFVAGDVLQLRIAQTDSTARTVGWRLGIERVV